MLKLQLFSKFLAVATAVCVASVVGAQDYEILDKRSVWRWTLETREYERGGKDCRAYICNTKECGTGTVKIELHIRGTVRTRRIEPFFYGRFTMIGAKNPKAEIDGRSFSLERLDDSAYFWAKSRSTDKKIMEALQELDDGTITFRDDTSSEKLRIKNFTAVRDYFASQCKLEMG